MTRPSVRGSRSACTFAAALVALAFVPTGCAPTRTLVLELRHADTLQPVAHARVRMHFSYFLRVWGPPPEYEFETDEQGRVVAKIRVYEPVFAFDLMNGNDRMCDLGSGTDRVEDGRAREWNRMYCYGDNVNHDFYCRFWFAGMPGEPPGATVPAAPVEAIPIPAVR